MKFASHILPHLSLGDNGFVVAVHRVAASAAAAAAQHEPTPANTLPTRKYTSRKEVALSLLARQT